MSIHALTPQENNIIQIWELPESQELVQTFCQLLSVSPTEV